MKPIKIGIDLDGCLADFNTAFIALIKEQTGIQLPAPSESYPDCWAYHRAGGVTADQDAKLWEAIAADPHFWFRLPAYPGAWRALEMLRKLALDPGWQIYFITARRGRLVKVQTENWLMSSGLMDIPTVLIASDKGPLAKGLELDAFIDDRPENCADVLCGSLARVYMVDRPYNRKAEIASNPGVSVVGSVVEAIKIEAMRANGKA